MIYERSPLSLIHVLYVNKHLIVLGLPIWTSVKVWGADALGQSVVAGVREVAAGVGLTCLLVSICQGVVSSDPQSRSVGHSRHGGGLFAFLLLPVDDEEEQEEEHQQHQDDDPCDGSDLVGVHVHGCAGQTVETAHHHHTCLVTSSSLPARVAVTCTSHVITGGVI